ncbi:hypothetical protein Taro_030640 [Colocasia esculenta]|uniref:Uncharacterized protein n=1 Tax=Colocasia esculenta TaxID=4460 RepID=A0A843VYI4_COLES|nr:hypothetical protein [Colocasia esculenta]
MAECKSEDQWAKGHSALYRKYLLAKSERFPPRDSPLTRSEWFVIHHKSLWAPFIQKEVKLISVKEDLVVSRVLFPSCEGRPAGVLGAVVSLRGTVPLLVKS